MIVKALLILAGCAVAYASDPTATYARVDRVVMQPNADRPETIQVCGVFALPKPNDRNDYLAPVKGCLFFKLPDSRQDVARTEWSDLKSVAGTKELVAFGSRSTWNAKVRTADEKAENPDVYALGFGLTKVRGRTDYAPIRAILDYKD
jgi:hypothetical protein